MARRSIVDFDRRLKDYRSAVGDYVVAFGNLESDIDDAVVSLLGPSNEHKAKMAISQILNVSTRIRLLVVLAALTTKYRRPVSKIAKIAVRMNDQNAFRNGLIHGAFDEFKTYRLPNKQIQHEWVKTKINPRSMKITTFSATYSQLKKNTRKIEHLGFDLRRAVAGVFLSAINAPFEPSIPKFGAQPPKPRRARRRKAKAP